MDRSRSGTPAGTSLAPAVTMETNDAPAIVEHPAEEGQCTVFKYLDNLIRKLFKKKVFVNFEEKCVKVHMNILMGERTFYTV